MRSTADKPSESVLQRNLRIERRRKLRKIEDDRENIGMFFGVEQFTPPNKKLKESISKPIIKNSNVKKSNKSVSKTRSRKDVKRSTSKKSRDKSIVKKNRKPATKKNKRTRKV